MGYWSKLSLWTKQSGSESASNSIEWFIEDQAFSPSIIWLLSLLPLLSISCLSFSVFLCCQSSLLRGEGGGGGAKSDDSEKAWSFINHSMRSGLHLNIGSSKTTSAILLFNPLCSVPHCTMNFRRGKKFYLRSCFHTYQLIHNLGLHFALWNYNFRIQCYSFYLFSLWFIRKSCLRSLHNCLSLRYFLLKPTLVYLSHYAFFWSLLLYVIVTNIL